MSKKGNDIVKEDMQLDVRVDEKGRLHVNKKQVVKMKQVII